MAVNDDDIKFLHLAAWRASTQRKLVALELVDNLNWTVTMCFKSLNVLMKSVEIQCLDSYNSILAEIMFDVHK